MTYDERIRDICEGCFVHNDCAYVKRGLEVDCGYLDSFSAGWEYGQQDTLEEIEKIMDMSKFYSDMSTNTRLYDVLVNKINELKML